MDAIIISEANLDKIHKRVTLTEAEQATVTRVLHRNYVIIAGYVPPRGEMKKCAVMPYFRFKDVFDHDPVRILTEWHQIVRND